MSSEKPVAKRKGISGLIFIGCLMLGFAIGFLMENIVVGLFAGLGIGFIALALMSYRTGSW